MFQAEWNGVVLAESDQTVKVEGNQYFPPGSVHWEYFAPSSTSTVCPWKGTAGYYDITVNGSVNQDAAWHYPQPSPAASRIKDHVAFWHGVKVTRVAGEQAGAARSGGVATRLRGMLGVPHRGWRGRQAC